MQMWSAFFNGAYRHATQGFNELTSTQRLSVNQSIIRQSINVTMHAKRDYVQ